MKFLHGFLHKTFQGLGVILVSQHTIAVILCIAVPFHRTYNPVRPFFFFFWYFIILLVK